MLKIRSILIKALKKQTVVKKNKEETVKRFEHILNGVDIRNNLAIFDFTDHKFNQRYSIEIKLENGHFPIKLSSKINTN